MDEIKTIKIRIEPKHYSNGNKSSLSDSYVEIYKPLENMKFLLGTWIKIKDRETNINSSGGFVVKIEGNEVTLRNKVNIDVVDMKRHFFYIKKDNPQYLSLKEFLLEKQKFFHEKEIFEKEKKDFESVSQKFYKLFLNGKVKISD